MSSSTKPTGGRRWWNGLFALKRPAVPFEVACPCGRVLRGFRRRRPQVLPCATCGQPVFIFPRSPWAADAPTVLADLPSAPSPAGRFWQTFRMPLLAAGLTLTLFAVGFVALLPFLVRSAISTSTPPRATGVQLSDRLDAGRRALAEGNFHVALRELNAAVELRDRQPDLLTPKQSRDLNQLQRQADLLARIHNLPLQDILKEAILTPRDEEWHVHFEATHQGRTVLFDDVVRRDAATGWLVPACFEVRAGSEKAVIALDDLRILRALPLDPPPRLIFGGRLRSMEREAGGAWVIRFEPESGVLLTDPDAAAACWPVPPDPDVLRTLQRQEEWLRDLPAQRPAP